MRASSDRSLDIRISALVLATLFVCASMRAHAQKLSISVNMTDSAAGGLFSSAFSNAFRSLGDVEVVSLFEKPALVLEGVVMCEPSHCTNARSYSLSLRLYSPFSEATADFVAFLVTPSLPRATHQARLDSATALISMALSEYENSHMTWTATWGSNRYEQAVREFVGTINSQCLEKKRAFGRMMASRDTSRFTTYNRLVKSQTWLC